MVFDVSAALKTMDIKQAAERIGRSEITLRRMIAKKEISHRRIGSGRGLIELTEDDVQDYLERRRVPVAA
jgi:excisionase family DNA binding protein